MTNRRAPSLLARLVRKSGAVTCGEIDRNGWVSAENLLLARVARLIESHLRPDGKLLDVGCWTGGLARALRANRRGFYTGVDIEPAAGAVEVARAAVPEGSFLVVPSAESLPFAAKTFDIVALIEVIEHVPPGRERHLLTELARVLRTGGSIIVTTPHHSILNPLDPAWFFGHRHYSLDRMRRLAQDQGLTIVDVHLSGGIWTSVDIGLFYAHKHVLHRPYVRQRWLHRRIAREELGSSTAFFATLLSCRLVHHAAPNEEVVDC